MFVYISNWWNDWKLNQAVYVNLMYFLKFEHFICEMLLQWLLSVPAAMKILQASPWVKWTNCKKYPSNFISAVNLIKFKQDKSEGFDSCDRHSNLTQILFKSSIFQPMWPCNLIDDLEK